ncbi:uncharacterized protein ACB058_006440 isoform 2-T2 [Synchiropus picturatus]
MQTKDVAELISSLSASNPFLPGILEVNGPSMGCRAKRKDYPAGGDNNITSGPDTEELKLLTDEGAACSWTPEPVAEWMLTPPSTHLSRTFTAVADGQCTDINASVRSSLQKPEYKSETMRSINHHDEIGVLPRYWTASTPTFSPVAMQARHTHVSIRDTARSCKSDGCAIDGTWEDRAAQAQRVHHEPIRPPPACTVLNQCGDLRDCSDEEFCLHRERIPTLQPDKFDGTGAWRDFLYQFESCARANLWSEETMTVQLRFSLTGAAGAIVHKNPRSSRWNYKQLIDEMEAAYGPGSEHAAATGIELRQREQAQLDFGRREITLFGEKVPRHAVGQVETRVVRVARSITLEPGCEYVLRGYTPRLKRTYEQTLLLSPTKSFVEKHHVLVAPTVLKGQRPTTIPVRVFNICSIPVTVKKGTVAGVLQAAEVVEESALVPSEVTTPTITDSLSSPVPDHLKELYVESCAGLPPVNHGALAELLSSFANVFSASPTDLGRTNLVKHDILTTPGPPVKLPPRRMGRDKQAAADEQDTLDTLSTAKFFSTLDLTSGYWQVEMTPRARKAAAFCTTKGLFEWNVMPFGLCNAPATFQRLMDRVLAGLQWETCLVYLDDIIVLGSDVEQMLERLGQGVATDPVKVDKVKNWPTPRSVMEVRQIVGLASYYRCFVKNFASAAKPLHELTKKYAQFNWTTECQNAFDELKDKLSTAPVLSYPLDQGELYLDTDASDCGIGAVLSQVQCGEEKVLAYGSRRLSVTEQNYCTTRRELLAVVNFTTHFRQYLLGRSFTVRTDHSSLRWLTKLKEPEGQLARWLEKLAEYDFQVVHRPVAQHLNADAMSRRPCRLTCPCAIPQTQLQCHQLHHKEVQCDLGKLADVGRPLVGVMSGVSNSPSHGPQTE